MGQKSEEQLTAEIEDTRQDLSRNLDALNDRVNPTRVIERQKEATRTKFRSVRDKVMGAAPSMPSMPSRSSSGTSSYSPGPSIGERASGAVGAVSNTATGAADTVTSTASGAVDTLQEKAEGNPLAAGLIAFGAGWLISSLLPASQKEAQAAAKLVDVAKEHGQPLVDEAKSVGQELGQNLKEAATDAAAEVKASAQDSAETVKAEGQSSAQTVKAEGQSSAQTVRDDTQQRLQ